MRYIVYSALLMVCIVMLLSGCVNNIPYNSTSLVKEFVFLPDNAYSGDEVYLKMVLENNQDFLVKDIYVGIYNLGSDWGIVDVWGEKKRRINDSRWKLDIDLNFDINGEMEVGEGTLILGGDVKVNDVENILQGHLPSLGLKNVHVYLLRKDVSIMITDIEKLLRLEQKSTSQRLAEVYFEKAFKKASKLPPVVVDYLYPSSMNGGKGENVELYWVIKIPHFPAGEEVINSVNARVCYKGVNKLVNAVRVVSKSEFLLGNKKFNIRKKIVRSQSGPVHVILEVQDPVIITDQKKDINFMLTVKNVGGGTVISKECIDVLQLSSPHLLQREGDALIKIEVEGDIDFRCSTERKIDFVLPSNSVLKIPLKCILYDDREIPEQERYLTIKVSYTYYEEVSTSIKVEGIEGELLR